MLRRWESEILGTSELESNNLTLTPQPWFAGAFQNPGLSDTAYRVTPARRSTALAASKNCPHDFLSVKACGNGLEVEEDWTLEQWFSNFHEPWFPSKFNWRILNISRHLGYAISRQSFLAKASVRGPQRTALRPPRGAEGPVEKPCIRVAFSQTALKQGWWTYLLSRVAWILHYCRRIAKSFIFILNFYLSLTMRKSDFF